MIKWYEQVGRTKCLWIHSDREKRQGWKKCHHEEGEKKPNWYLDSCFHSLLQHLPLLQKSNRADCDGAGQKTRQIERWRDEKTMAHERKEESQNG